METIQIVLDAPLLREADRAARRLKVNRSALVRAALQQHLKRLQTVDKEARDRDGLPAPLAGPRRTGRVGRGGGMAGRIERGDIRLYRFPAPDKPRPVLVLTRPSALGYLSRVTVAPITSAIRDVPSEVVLGTDDGMKQPCAVNLHNVVTVARDALGRRVARLDQSRMRDVCSALAFAFGCDG